MSDIRFVFLGVVLVLATLDAFSTWMLILFYTTDIDIVGLVNYNFMIMSAVQLVFALLSYRQFITRIRRAGDLSIVLLLLLAATVLGVASMVVGVFEGADLGLRHAVTHFYGLGMPLVCLALASQFELSDIDRVNVHVVWFAWCYSIISFSGILVYAVLYYLGYITYFGLGTNAHYVFPWLIASKGPLLILPVGFLILISGKRAVLLNFIVQSMVYFSRDAFRRPLLGAALSVGTVATVYFLTQYTSLLDRFVLSIGAAFNLSDPQSLLVAFGGRGEEVVGIQQYFAAHPLDILLGAPPGASYQWVIEASSLDQAKNYAHVTPFGLVFRYGIIFTVALYGLFAYFLIKYFSPKDPYYLVFVGIVSSTAFGANMIVDPTTWLFIGLMLKLSRKPVARASAPASAVVPGHEGVDCR